MRQLWLISTNGFHVCLCLLVSLTCGVLAPAAATLGDAAAGKAIYNQACVSCHGADGKGGSMAGMLPVTPRNLADRSYMQTRSADQLFDIIKHGGTAEGLSSSMPGFNNQLTDTQIRDTVAYIQSLSAAAPAAADAAPATPTTPAAWRIARMRLSIWPEYDDPRVLMIIRGEIEPPNALPATLNLPIPKDAELIGAGMISEQNALLNHPHQVIPGEAHDTLTITLPVPGFFAEWYYDPWTSREAKRQFTYTFTPPYPIDQLEVDIQQPYEAIDFRTTPEEMGQHVDGQGGKYALFSYRDLAAHAPLTFTVTYIKKTDRPSVTKRQPMPDGEIATALLRQKTIVAFSLLAGFTGIYASCVVVWRNYRRHRTSPSAPATQLPPLTTSSSVALRPNFCSDCGRKLQSADLFCPGCGRSLNRA
jgi:mono/diheme cytochrome c family protein